MAIKITKQAVDKAEPGKTDAFLWDSELKGFGLKITPAGGKTYVYQYRIAEPGKAANRTPTRRYTIGKHGPLTPDQARKRATELAGKVAAGIDPKDEETAAAMVKVEAKRAEAAKTDLVFEKIAPLWLADYEAKDRRPSTVRLARTVVDFHLMPKLTGKPLPDIGKADLRRVLSGIPAKQRGIKRAVYVYANVFFKWAVEHDHIQVNPLADITKPDAPKARDTVLSDDELKAIWKATGDMTGPFAALFRLLILTGQRRSEVAGMMWGELDRAAKVWTIPTARAKNGAAHIVPLSGAVMAELDVLAGGDEWPTKGFVFTTTGKTAVSGFTKAKAALDVLTGTMPDWRLHDLRRTMATGFQKLGVRFEVTEAVLNHISGSKGGVAGIYQRHDWADEKRAALDVWSKHVEGLIADKSNVVPLKAAS